MPVTESDHPSDDGGAPGAGAGPGALPADRLIAFYTDHRRDLPWREPGTTPWGVLVSEVMLQQTQVARVVPAYRQWIERWPTPPDLAAEPSGEAVRAWGRLGYPRRALRLHAAATAITDRHHGRVPDTVDELLTLPGVGEYTARAVAAFGYRRRAPVVDTNVLRVLSRATRGVDTRASATATDRRDLDRWLPQDPDTAATFSIAVMELGALLCTTGEPGCSQCPISDDCAWRAAGYPAAAAVRRQGAWAGSDRQVRGRIMAALRDAPAAVAEGELAAVWPDVQQWRRCLDSLLADGLAVRVDVGWIGLPG
nr:A/G-specific adenine glycosylase [Nakamurella leprariae]